MKKFGGKPKLSFGVGLFSLLGTSFIRSDFWYCTVLWPDPYFALILSSLQNQLAFRSVAHALSIYLNFGACWHLSRMKWSKWLHCDVTWKSFHSKTIVEWQIYSVTVAFSFGRLIQNRVPKIPKTNCTDISWFTVQWNLSIWPPLQYDYLAKVTTFAS